MTQPVLRYPGILVAGALALITLTLAVLPSASSGLTQAERVKDLGIFRGQECGDESRYTLNLPARAKPPLRAVRPEIGDKLSDYTYGGDAATIIDAQINRTSLTWTAKALPEDDTCQTSLYDVVGWFASAEVIAEYQRRVKLRTLRAKIISQRALQRHFGAAFKHGYAFREKCGRRSSVRMRCRVSWVIGDGSYSGMVMVWLSKKREKIRTNYRYRINRVDEFCQAVQDGSSNSCTKTYRGKGRG